MNRDGSNLQCAGYEGYNKQPAWSPKGDQIVFQRQCGEKECWQLWLAKTNLDGTINKQSTVQFTHEYRSNTDASWSPDGAKKGRGGKKEGGGEGEGEGERRGGSEEGGGDNRVFVWRRYERKSMYK